MVSTLGGCVCRNSGHRAEPSERGGSRNQHVVKSHLNPVYLQPLMHCIAEYLVCVYLFIPK